MEEDFVTYLKNYSGISSLVGQRLDWAIRPQASSLPQIVLHKIDGQPFYTDEGESGLFNCRIQIDCWGKIYSEAKRVARQVLARISGMNFIQGSTTFQLSHCEDEQDTFERGAGDEEFYRVRLDFILIYKR